MCGPKTTGMEMAQGKLANLTSLLTGNYNERFGQQTELLNNINSILTPIFEAGPNQTGMSAPELAALNTGAVEGVAGEYAKAGQALRNTLAARGGGNEFLPSGARASLESGLATQAAQETARQKQAITLQNYAQGRQNWAAASAGLNALAGLENPTPYADIAGNVGQSAFGDAQQIYNAKNAKYHNALKALATGITDVATFGMGGFGNLGVDSTFGENVGNFFSGGLNALKGN